MRSKVIASIFIFIILLLVGVWAWQSLFVALDAPTDTDVVWWAVVGVTVLMYLALWTLIMVFIDIIKWLWR